MSTMIDSHGTARHAAGAPASTGGQFAAKRSGTHDAALTAYPKPVVDFTDRDDVDFFQGEIERGLDMDSPHPFWVHLRHEPDTGEVSMQIQSSASFEGELDHDDLAALNTDYTSVAAELEERYGADGFELIDKTVSLHWGVTVPSEQADLDTLMELADDRTGRLVDEPLTAERMREVIEAAKARPWPSYTQISPPHERGETMIDSNGAAHQPAGAPSSTGGQFARKRSAAHSAILADPEPPIVKVARRHGEAFPASELSERGLTENDVELVDEPVLMPEDMSEGFGYVDLDEVRKWLNDSSHADVGVVQLFVSEDDDEATLEVLVYHDFLQSGEFTEEELDENHEVVAEVYREWFGGELDTAEGWRDASLNMSIPVRRDIATESILFSAAYNRHAKYLNETDRGTFGSPYVGSELRRRIDAAKSN